MSEQIKIIAILRGIETADVETVFGALITAGISMIEIPLNSPEALKSIELATGKFGDLVSVGAGTVLSRKDVKDVAETGATFVVSPNCNAEVIGATLEQKMASYPGIMTPSEAFCAIEAGATGLKIFPAELVGPAGIKAMKAVLPPDIALFAVGGACPDNFEAYVTAGCSGFGLGSFLYRPGDKAAQVRKKAKLAIEAIRKIEQRI